LNLQTEDASLHETYVNSDDPSVMDLEKSVGISPPTLLAARVIIFVSGPSDNLNKAFTAPEPATLNSRPVVPIAETVPLET